MKSAVVVGHGNGDIRADAEHRLDPRRPIERTAGDIEIPQAYLGGLGGEPQLLLAFAERPGGGSLIGHVDAPPNEAHESPAPKARNPVRVHHPPPPVFSTTS